MVNTNKHNNIKKQRARQTWKRDVVWFMKEAGYADIAERYRSCGTSFWVDVCHADLNHEPKAIPIHCGNRFCEHCEHRESYRKLQRYQPALEALLKPNEAYPDYCLRKLVLTTPYSLASLTSKTFAEKQRFVNDFFSVYFFWYFHERGELSKQEIRSGRCNLKQHGLAWLCSQEFGERGKKLHWHCLVYAPFMPHSDICAVWRDVTNNECQNASIMSIYADPDGEIDGVNALKGAIKEIVKYATKLTALPAQDVPHFYEVLKGNRRFRTGGTLNGIKLPDDEVAYRCECGAERERLSIGQYVTRCMNNNVPISDEVADAVEDGIRIYLSSEHEITSGKSPTFYRKARDSIESEV